MAQAAPDGGYADLHTRQADVRSLGRPFFGSQRGPTLKRLIEIDFPLQAGDSLMGGGPTHRVRISAADGNYRGPMSTIHKKMPARKFFEFHARGFSLG